jgi:hypothetical protein
MVSSKQEEKYSLQMSGEYGVCAELHKRNITASITYGKHKAANVFIIRGEKASRIEVKTTNKNKVVTGFFQKYTSPETKPAPDFWVLVYIDSETFISDFYILSHNEMAAEQMKVNKMESWYEMKGGICTIQFSHLEKYKNKWDILLNYYEKEV